MRYTIQYREADGILICRMYGFMDETVGGRFGADLLTAQATARAKAGHLRLLIDNREGRVAAPDAAAALIDQFRSTVQPEDRSALLVTGSLNKTQAKRTVMSDLEIFMSEDAAVTWLTAYDGKAAARA